ncbi:hypothetical protein [Sorangium sp. So ce1151]|uniref:hypothetical protein n=1 Tax=Sorangium sp. So ce1151 TaxID=3133332 RepID=UPI003F5EBF41
MDDIAALNAAVEPLDLYPNRPPEKARRFGRYVLTMASASCGIRSAMRRRRIAAVEGGPAGTAAVGEA